MATVFVLAVRLFVLLAGRVCAACSRWWRAAWPGRSCLLACVALFARVGVARCGCCLVAGLTV